MYMKQRKSAPRKGEDMIWQWSGNL